MKSCKLIIATICFILFVPFILNAQNQEKINELIKQANEAKHDTLKADIYLDIAKEYEDTDELLGKSFLSKAASIYKKFPKTGGLGEVYYRLGFMNEYFNKKDSSILCFNLAIDDAKKQGHEIKLSRFYVGKGWYYMRQKENPTAIIEYQKSIDISKKYNLKIDWADALRKIANLIIKTEDYKKAFNLYREAYSLYLSENDSLHAAQTLGGLGYAFKEATMYDSAAHYLNIAASKFIALKNYSMVVIANAEIANLSTLLGKPNIALDYINKANEIKSKTTFKLYDDVINIYHANALKALGNYNEAIKKYHQGIEIAKEQGDIDNVHNGYLWLFETYEKNNDYKNAFKYQTLYEQIEDSVSNKEKLNTLQELSTKYDFEKQQRELEKKDFEVKKKNAIIYFSIGFLILVLVAAYMFYKRKTAEQKTILQQKLLEQEKQATINILAAEENERKRIATDLHDGVGQILTATWLNLQQINDQVQTNNAPNKDFVQKTLHLMDEGCKEVRAVSHNMMPNALLKKGLIDAVREFIQQINTKQTQINLQTQGLQKALPNYVEAVLYRVIQESVNNVIKHANASRLDISISQDEQGNLDVMIEDNGKGFNVQEAFEKDGIGLKNIKSRIEYLKGSVEWDSSPTNGTVVAIHIPASHE